jgi:transcriptional regulator with XRE-family HTH domain
MPHGRKYSAGNITGITTGMSRTISRRLPDAARLVREAREKLGLTQEELARELEVAVSTVRNWESRGVRPRKAILKRVHEMAARRAQERPRERRASSETRAQAIAALEMILERAPEEIVRDVVDFLSSRAVKYGAQE